MSAFKKGDLVLLNKSCQNWLSRKFAYVYKVEPATNTVLIVVRQRDVENGSRYAVGLHQISKPTERQLKHPNNIKELEWQNR
jgi:hypothetical protein